MGDMSISFCEYNKSKLNKKIKKFKKSNKIKSLDYEEGVDISGIGCKMVYCAKIKYINKEA